MRDFPLAELPLARRLEGACARDLAAFATGSRENGMYPAADTLRVGGGVCVWYSPDNVVNGSFGLGMEREVEQEEVAALVAFFGEQGEAARIDVCPHAHRSLLRWLAEYRFVATAFEMVLYRPLLPGAMVADPAPRVTVRLAETAEERAVWAELEATGFTDGHASAEHRHLSDAIAQRADGVHFLGYLDGRPVGTGMLTMADGLAMLNCDATLPEARNRGVQGALIAARTAFAAEAGCDLCMIEAAPGGSSYRNQQRAGFRVAYNRVTFELPSGK